MPADMTAAARDLARGVAGVVAREPVSLTVKNLSKLPATATAEIRGVFETELKIAQPATAEIQLTISENLTGFLLVAEIHRGGARQVLIESFPRATATTPPVTELPPQVMLEKKLLWEQDRPILDAIETGAGLLVLDATRVLLVHGDDRQSAPIPATHPWPRDMRGHLSAGDGGFTAYLPGTICQGATEAQLSLACRDSQDPWLIAPSVLATFSPDRNIFLGHLDIAPGGPHDLPPFYSAAATGDGAGDGWIVAAADGRTTLYTGVWEPAGTLGPWGSDLAAIATPCGRRILATRPTGLDEGDAIQPYAVVDHTANAACLALDFSGPITALWSSGGSATVVSHDLETGRYAAYSLAPACH